MIELWSDLDVFFIETPLWTDDVAGYAELSARSPVRIAAGEWLSTRHDFEVLINERKLLFSSSARARGEPAPRTSWQRITCPRGRPSR